MPPSQGRANVPLQPALPNFGGSPVKITQTAILYPDGNFDFQQYPPQPLYPPQPRNLYKNESAEKDQYPANQQPHFASNQNENANPNPNQTEVNQNYYNPYMYLNQQATGGPNPGFFRG